MISRPASTELTLSKMRLLPRRASRETRGEGRDTPERELTPEVGDDATARGWRAQAVR